MAGGLLNIKAHGQASIILFGNPKKTLFKAVYKSITNFGMQRLRINFTGNTALMLTRESTFNFTVPRFADLVGDMYLCVTIPDIWSPFMYDNSNNIVETNFRWIRELGTNMIQEMRVYSGSHTLARYTGEYFSLLAHRDVAQKKQLWDEMTGNVVSMYDPANAFGREGNYPNSVYLNDDIMPEPSIRGRKLYIPLSTWFSRDVKLAFPLIALQYNTLNISITLRPVLELFNVRDIKDNDNNYPYVSPLHLKENGSIPTELFFRPPEKIDEQLVNIPSETSISWDPDIHIMSTFYFLSEKERTDIARQEHNFLVKDVHQHEFLNATGPQTQRLYSMGLVSGYSFRFRRSDAFLRNEWSNYTNWPYHQLPFNIQHIEDPSIKSMIDTTLIQNIDKIKNPCPFVNPHEEPVNDKNILREMAILLNGKFRETDLDAGIYQFVEPYARTDTLYNLKDGLYYYSFATTMSAYEYQPTGAINMDAFELIQFQYDTLRPPVDVSNANIVQICNNNGDIIGVRKNNWELKEYNFDLEIFEERYNVVRIVGGNVGMYFAR